MRTVALGAALAGLALVPLAVWGATSLSDDGGELLVERAPGGVVGSPELIVSLPSEEVNDLDTAGGDPSIVIACLDAEGQVEFRVAQPFPFTDTDGGREPPHVHQLVPLRQLAAVERCRLEGATVELEGELQQPAPPSEAL